MIKIDLDSEGRRTKGTIKVYGDAETLTYEIYAILTTLCKECLVPLNYAVEKHLQDMRKEQEDGKDYS